MHAFNPLCLAFVLLVGTSFRISAEDGGRVEGQVLDPSGSVVPGAVLTLTPSDAEPVTARSDAHGSFAFTGLRAGRYDLEAQVEGFKPSSVRVEVAARGKVAAVQIRLELAGVAEELAVEASTGSTGSSDNRDAIAVDQALLSTLPVLDGDYISTLAAFLDPGSVDSSGVSLVVNGAEASRAPASASSIQEVKINQNPYSAEFLRPGRGRIEITTKQEQPEYHGSANLAIRDSRLSSKDFFADEKAPEQRRLFDLALSGPVGRSKTTTFQLSLLHRNDDIQAIVVATEPEGEIRANIPAPQQATDLAFRITQRIGKSHLVSAEFVLEDRKDENQGVGGFVLPEAGTNRSYREHQLFFQDQFLFSPNLINQFSLRLEWNGGSTTSVNPDQKIVVQDAFTGGGAQADQSSTEKNVKFSNTLSWSKGRHLLKVGVQGADWAHRTYDDRTNRRGTFSFASLDDYSNGRPFSFAIQSGDGYVPVFQQIVGGLVQDEVKLRQNLSVALGLRYDYQNFYRAGLLSSRVFAAYSPGKGSAWVVRAGVGFFPDRFPPGAYADVLRGDGAHLDSYLVLNPSYPRVLTGLTGPQPKNLVQLDPTLRTPYAIQYSGTVEWRAAKQTTLTATYRGDRGVSLLRSRDINAPGAPSYDTRPDSAVGRLRQIESAGRQAGDALEFTLRGRLGRVFNGMVQYTFSRTRNNTGGVGFYPAATQEPLAEWGLADFDQPHRLNLLGTIEIPRALKVGVSLATASARPYSVTTGQDSNNDGLTLERPAGVARNAERGPGSFVLNLRFSRDFFLVRAKKDKSPSVTLGADIFNLFNTYSPTTIVGNESSPYFGEAVAALPARRMQISARLAF